MSVKGTQTVRDLWRMSSSAAAAAAAAAYPDYETDHRKISMDEVVAKAAAAAAAAASPPSPRGGDANADEHGTEGNHDHDDADRDEAFVLPLGQVLMRQHKAGAAVTASGDAGSTEEDGRRPLSNNGAGDSLCFPDDLLGARDCRLEDGEELVLVSRAPTPNQDGKKHHGTCSHSVLDAQNLLWRPSQSTKSTFTGVVGRASPLRASAHPSAVRIECTNNQQHVVATVMINAQHAMARVGCGVSLADDSPRSPFLLCVGFPASFFCLTAKLAWSYRCLSDAIDWWLFGPQ